MSDTIVSLSCAEAELHMQAYLDGMLDADTVRAVDAHLGSCDDCRSAYHFEVKLRAHVRRCCGDAEDERCREELRERLRGCADCD